MNEDIGKEIDDDTIWDFGTTNNGKRLSDITAQYLLWYWGIKGWQIDDKYHKYIKSAYNDLMREAASYIAFQEKQDKVFPTRDINGKDLTV